MTDRDALIERVKAAEKSATHRERNTGGDGNAVVSLYDLRALISLASPSLPELVEGWEWVATPTTATIDRMKADVRSSLASPSPAPEDEPWGEPWGVLSDIEGLLRTALGAAQEALASVDKPSSPSPAQWPKDVVERAIQAWVGPEYRAKPKREHYAKMRAVLDSVADAIFSKIAALATLPPPEDERVKGLIEALAAYEKWEKVVREQLGEAIHAGLRKGSDAPSSGPLWQAIRRSDDSAWSDAIAFALSGFDYMAPLKAARSALASYRGGA